MTDMNDIETLAKDYATSRARLTAHALKIEAEIKAARTRGMPKLRVLIERAAAGRHALEVAIGNNPGLFKRPRTRLLHGIKLGFAKAKGTLNFVLAPEIVVRLIRKHLPEQADTLIKVTETPVKPALAQLSGAELKRIGVSVKDTGDQVVIKLADSEIEKLIDAMVALAGDTQQEEEIAS